MCREPHRIWTAGGASQAVISDLLENGPYIVQSNKLVSKLYFLQFETNLVVNAALITMFQSRLEAIDGDPRNSARRLKLPVRKDASAIEFRLAGTADVGVLMASADLNQRKSNFGKRVATDERILSLNAAFRWN
jgi:hypothetical protein